MSVRHQVVLLNLRSLVTGIRTVTYFLGFFARSEQNVTTLVTARPEFSAALVATDTLNGMNL